ncbi:WD repeat and SOF domain-containing protein 1, partial [Mytilus galloprovincialis]
VKVWSLAKRSCLQTIQAHEGMVQGLCMHQSGRYFFSVGNDKTIKQWSLSECGQIEEEPQSTILGKTNIVGSCASDRSIILYDMRGAAPLRKVILKLRSNTIAWNPMEAFIFTVANEDYNLYSFDMRKLSMPVTVHMDHVSAVMDVDYSPTGREFASAGYDKVVRIFPADRTHSREIYHTKRMQRVETVRWSLDNKYILSGSDEMNIRIWKAQASEKLGVLKPREKTAFNYNSKLKEKFAFHPEVKRISRHRHVPKMIYNQQKEMRIIRQSQKRKEANRRKHSKPGAVPFVPERKKSIIKEVE